MLDPAVCADPQTLEPCWRLIRMVRTYVLTYIHACIHMIFLRYKFRMKFLVRLPLSVLLYVSNVWCIHMTCTYTWFTISNFIIPILIFQRLIPNLLGAIAVYDSAKVVTVPYKNSIEYIKEYCASQNLLEPSSYPLCFPVLKLLSMWISRAINAREFAISYYKEKGSIIEIIREDNQIDNNDDDDEDE